MFNPLNLIKAVAGGVADLGSATIKAATNLTSNAADTALDLSDFVINTALELKNPISHASVMPMKVISNAGWQGAAGAYVLANTGIQWCGGKPIDPTTASQGGGSGQPIQYTHQSAPPA